VVVLPNDDLHLEMKIVLRVGFPGEVRHERSRLGGSFPSYFSDLGCVYVVYP
jgi:hypothetical protein